MGPDGFLNVDLEIGARSRTRLAPLLDVLDGQLFELFAGRLRSLYRVHYETKGCARDASATIRELVAVIEGLGPPARRAWDAAVMRDFNVGAELERGVRSVDLAIEPDVVRQVAGLGGRIVFTAYQVAAMGRPVKLRRAPRTR